MVAHTNLSEIIQTMDLLWLNNIDPAQVNMGYGFYGRSGFSFLHCDSWSCSVILIHCLYVFGLSSCIPKLICAAFTAEDPDCLPVGCPFSGGGKLFGNIKGVI